MANIYYSQQIAGDTSITENDWTNLNPIEFSSDYTDDKLDYQQWVGIMPGNGFSENTSYIVKMEIAQNFNYTLDYGIRLITLDPQTPQDLRQVTNYDFVKYITIPPVNSQNSNSYYVWLYHITDPNETGTYEGLNNQPVVNAAVAVEIEPNSFNTNTIERYFSTNQRAFKFFFCRNGDNIITTIYKYDANGIVITDNGGQPINYINKIEYNSNLTLPHFGSEQTTDTLTYYFIFTPTISGYNAIYFYLRPIPEDDEIQWINEDNQTMRGRSTTIKSLQCYPLTNIVNNITSEYEIVNIGIWGRSEQLIAINGQGIEIGPSGYFELKDFTINSLCIANTMPTDKYIVDIQYQDKQEEN